MSKVINFQDAIDTTNGENRTLLIVTSFSMVYFSYLNRLAEAKLNEHSSTMRLLSLNGVYSDCKKSRLNILLDSQAQHERI